VISGDGFNLPDALGLRSNTLWVANGSNTVSELAASSGALVRLVHGNRLGLVHPDAIALDGTSVFVSNISGNSVTELDARTGKLVRVIRGARYRFDDPVALVATGPLAWVVNEAGDSATGFLTTSGALVHELFG